MSTTPEANLGTTAVRAGFELDAEAIAGWMTAHVADYRDPIRFEQFRGGQSNPTYKIVTPARSYVLRRKPPGELLKGAHAVDREARVLTALATAGFPVAHVHGLCMDETVIGAPFYVMDMVEGRIFWDATLPEIDRDERPAYFNAMNRTIAALHAIDPAAIGLADYGRPGNYFARQVARWSRQYLEDDAAGRDPNMDRLVEWLPRNLPDDDATSIVHGDFRIDNMIFHPSEPRILAVLDWELSTLGHPLADFAYHALMYRMPADIVAGLAGADLMALNLPDERTYADAYAARAGRSLAGYDFAVAFNFFRLAAIFHGIRGRLLRGTASSEQARERSEAFPRLAALAWEQARRV